MAKQAHTAECPNAACIPTVDVKVLAPKLLPHHDEFTNGAMGNTVTVIRGDTGAELPAGVVVSIPAGTKLTLSAEANGGERYKFTKWLATDTLINGSRSQEEELVVVPLTGHHNSSGTSYTIEGEGL